MSTSEQPADPSSALVAPVPPLHAAHESSSRVDGSGVSLHPDLFAKIVTHVSFAAWSYADRIAGRRVDTETLDTECSVAVIEACRTENCSDQLQVLCRAERYRLRDEFMMHFYLRRLGDQAVSNTTLLVKSMMANAINRETIAAQQREHAAEVATLRETVRDLNERVGKSVAR